MFDKKTLTPEDLATTVRAVRAAENLTQQEVADRLGISKAAVSKAENYLDGDGMQGVRTRIIEAFTDYRVEGPTFTLVRKAEG